MLGIKSQGQREASPHPSQDVEKGSQQLDTQDAETESNGSNIANLVTWDGPDDSRNPKNWSSSRKWAATFVVSFFTLISPISSAMIAPGLEQMSQDIDINSRFLTTLSFSIFVLAYALGPLFLGPISEVFGRFYALQLSSTWFIAWNLACGFSQNTSEIIVFRFLSGIGGSAPLAAGAGVLSDCWNADQRAKAVAIYSVTPLLGPAIGPFVGGFIVEYSTWRWVFWASSIAAALIQFCGIFLLPETHGPTLLKRLAKKQRKETGNQALHTEDSDKTLGKVLRVALVRPFIMLGTQPIVMVIAAYMAYLFGLVYLLISTFPGVYQGVYGESVGIAGLNYISLGIGYLVGSQVNAPISSRNYQRLKKQHGVGKAEFRIPTMFVGSALIPIGLFWYGWSVDAHIHWIMPNIGIVIFSMGAITCMQVMQTYVIDAYTTYAASGLAAVTVLRSLAGFGFPLFAPAMYDTLHYGWGNSLLALIGIVVGLPAPLLFWRYGERLRSISPYAAG